MADLADIRRRALREAKLKQAEKEATLKARAAAAVRRKQEAAWQAMADRKAGTLLRTGPLSADEKKALAAILERLATKPKDQEDMRAWLAGGPENAGNGLGQPPAASGESSPPLAPQNSQTG